MMTEYQAPPTKPESLDVSVVVGLAKTGKDNRLPGRIAGRSPGMIPDVPPKRYHPRRNDQQRQDQSRPLDYPPSSSQPSHADILPRHKGKGNAMAEASRIDYGLGLPRTG
jgi:hypothetical protein